MQNNKPEYADNPCYRILCEFAQRMDVDIIYSKNTIGRGFWLKLSLIFVKRDHLG